MPAVLCFYMKMVGFSWMLHKVNKGWAFKIRLLEMCKVWAFKIRYYVHLSFAANKGFAPIPWENAAWNYILHEDVHTQLAFKAKLINLHQTQLLINHKEMVLFLMFYRKIYV
jgi:hypothetical protein